MGQKCPSTHSEQSSALVIAFPSCASAAFWCRPAGHGSGAGEPVTQYDPAEHAKHPVFPVAFWNEPAGHGSHVAEPEALAAYPAVHGMHTDASLSPGTGLALPASQS